ncbi:hydrogenase formation protein HypD [Ectothiorhodospira shaposhnikovii]|uniref:hydrogenase formation protein HypD n=1 Tax=Ectothiorhodospira shaposhnikovii TaxID=1054 RepID=UPI0019083373|nr:hydrogenase formation protein HypD [Ectothiorhodospira shaposhnikovii]MBK1674544.1 hydrogenase formation protein HypD [Ectothiorhodospira shaposhnikovii]
MKYIDEFRDGEKAGHMARLIHRQVREGRSYRLMEFCGGHTHAIFRYGLVDLLPREIELIHGPGCPVCVLPVARLDMAIELARRPEVILCTYGDMLRVPASDGTSLLKVRAEGGDVRMLYSPLDVLDVARDNLERQVVFFAIGFETTTPPTALLLRQADQLGLTNLSVFCNHVLTPAAMHAILSEDGPLHLDGFIGPAHVSTVIGSQAYEAFPAQYGKPVVIAGFEPLDVLQAILLLVGQLNAGRAEVENQFTRAVTPQGNLKARHLMDEVFTPRDSFEWRGLGSLPASALCLRPGLAHLDAEQRFTFSSGQSRENKACECPAILRGRKKPSECRLFGNPCTPETPQGSCMVSAEGACAAYYGHGRYRTRGPLLAKG